MADDKIRYVLDVDDKGTPKLVKFGAASEKSGKQAKKAFDGAGKSVTDFAGQIPGASGALSMFSAGPAAAAGAAIAAVGVGFAAAMKKSIDFADGINDLSLRLGVSTEQLSVLSLYAEQSGTDIETLATGMGKLGVKISEGDKSLKKYGVTAGTADEALFQLADKIAGTEDPILRLKIATDAFGKSGQKMLPMLVQGGDALRQMSDAAPIVTGEMAAMSDALNDRFAELQGRILGIGLGVAEKIIPQIDAWLDGVDRIRRAMGMLSADEEYQAKRTEARQKIVNTYADLMEKRKAGEKLIGKVSGPVQIGGLTLSQSLAAFDRNNPAARPNVTPKPIAAGEFGAGADEPVKKLTKQTDLLAEQMANNFDVMAEWRDFDQAQTEAIDARKKEQFQNPWTSNEEARAAQRLQDLGLIGENGVGVVDATQMDLQEMLDLIAQVEQSLDPMAQAAIDSASKVEEAWTSAMVDIANSSSNVLANGFMKIGDGFDEMASSILDGFAQMLMQMVAQLAANAVILGFLSMIAPGAAAGFGEGLTGISGALLGGKATGGIPEVGAVTAVNERRQELFVPRTSGRVEPVAPTGDVYHFTYSNPAQARSLIRGLKQDKRKRNTAVA